MNKLINDCREIIVEFGFTQRWAEIEKFWLLGKAIVEAKVKQDKVKDLAEQIALDEEEVWNAIIFYKQYPDLSLFPSGKNITWSSIKREL